MGSTANDIQEMQQLLASIRQAIEEHGAMRQPSHSQADDLLGEAAMTAEAEEGRQDEWLDDDLEWVEPHMQAEHGLAEEEQHAHSEAPVSHASTQAAGAMVAEEYSRPAVTQVSSGAAIGNSATAAATPTAAATATAGMAAVRPAPVAESTPRTATPARKHAPHLSVLSGGRSDAAVLGNSRLSAPVQARVKAAMARLERIEAARQALGGEAALRRLVADLVEPLIEDWLEKNLPDIVERRVQAELDRILKRNG